MATTIGDQQLRVFCPTHKINFEVPNTSRILCESGGHALAHNFPHQDYWEYCCDCQHYWPSEMAKGGKAKEQCPVCSRETVRRYICDECKVVSLESDDAGRRKAFRIGARGAVEPSCPGCMKVAKNALQAHECKDAAAGFVTARAECPFCDEPVKKEAAKNREESAPTCLNCGTAGKPTDKFCKKCGKPVGAMIDSQSSGARDNPPLGAPQVHLVLQPEPERQTYAPPPVYQSSSAQGFDSTSYSPTGTDQLAATSAGKSSAKMAVGIMVAILVLGAILGGAMLSNRGSSASSFSAKIDQALAANQLFDPSGESVADLYEVEAARSPNSAALKEAATKIRSRIEPVGDDAFRRYYIESDQTVDWDYTGNIYKLLQKMFPGDQEFKARYAYSLGQSALRRKDYQSALASFQEALRYHPDWAMAFNGVGRVYLQEDWAYRDESKTVEYYKKACQVDSNFTWGCKNLGEYYSRKGNWVLAEEYMRKALERAPNRQSILKAMERICPKLGMYQKADGFCGGYND